MTRDVLVQEARDSGAFQFSLVRVLVVLLTQQLVVDPVHMHSQSQQQRQIQQNNSSQKIV